MPLDAADLSRLLRRRLPPAPWLIALAGAALFVAVGVAAWRGIEMLSASDAVRLDRGGYQAEEPELRFWLAALRRIEAEQQQQPNGAPMASLQLEEAAVLQRLREVAERVPPEQLPAEIGALLDRAAAPPRQPVAATATPAAAPPVTAPPEPIELRVGLGSRAETPDFSSLAVSASSLLPVVVERRPTPRRKASAEQDDKRPPKDRDEKPPAR